jgi:hypothetical protein
MLSEFFLFSGLLVLSLGLRSIQHPLVFRLGHLGLVATTYLFGYRIGGHHAWGTGLASIWFLLPWVDILGRVRRTQLPIARAFSTQPAPGSRRFPQLEEMTQEVEEEGFMQVDDFGWNHGEQRHSMRVFAFPAKRMQATIHFIESADADFFYVSITSRHTNGEQWTTWNYPFLLSLKPAPTWHLQNRADAENFLQLVEMHEVWIQRFAFTDWTEVPVDAALVLRQIETETSALVSHNLKCGVLAHGEEGMVRYTVRGCFFLWLQFLRDLMGAR